MRCLLVNPVSNGSLLARYLISRGVTCDAVIELDKVAKMGAVSEARQSDFDGSLYERIYRSEDDASSAEDVSYDAVIAGSENGVATAERLAQHFGLPGNDPDTTLYRTDKAVMQEVLRAAGLQSATTRRVFKGDDVVAIAAALGGYPIILKPAASAGSEGVVLCTTPKELLTAWAAIDWGAFSPTWHDNDSFVLQSYLEGPEFCVDLVAKDGLFAVSAISRYIRCGELAACEFPFVKAFKIPCPIETPTSQKLAAYAKSCAEVLAVREGPLHLEAIFTSNGPVLVEVGARLHGTQLPSFLRHSYQHDLLEQVFEAYFKRDLPLSDAVFTTPIVQRYVVATKEGHFKGLTPSIEQELKKLDTCLANVISIPNGSIFPRTESLFDVPVQGFFGGGEIGQIWRDVLAHQDLIGDLFHEALALEDQTEKLGAIHQKLICPTALAPISEKPNDHAAL
ncbi:ATP-grasp domain-containing protein [Shimia isoporae]|uniref:ATP-grasp domain-containing protein n=1 Tax=Shimia isoporae TaxID=647720 RepID=A0A4R1NKV9_9RHOB|nr:ATP-grasp domain-containing protein [Shimia isoporae]TCL08301.1 ATP-grasp domain-containing protein [Shimia isoporae]